MKFKKTALAVALAGMAATPFAQADVTLSGYIGIILGGSDAEIVDEDTGEVDDSVGDPAFSSDDSTINASATHTMNNGLTAYGNYRLDSGLTGSTPAGDNVWVGIRGGFGDIRLGEVPDALEYGQVANDALFDIGGENAGISYTGGFGPVTLGVNWSPQNDSDKTSAGVKFALGGFNIGVGVSDIDGETRSSVGAGFSFAGASVAVALKDVADNPAGAADFSTVGFQVGYGIAGVSIGVTYEAFEDGARDGDNLLRLDLGYDLGGGMNISTRFNVLSAGDNSGTDEVTDYRVLLAKSF